MSAKCRLLYRLILGQDVDQVSVAMLFKLVDRQSPLSVDTWLVCQSTLGSYVTINSRWHVSALSVVYRLTVGGICVLLTVVFAEMEAVS